MENTSSTRNSEPSDVPHNLRPTSYARSRGPEIEKILKKVGESKAMIIEEGRKNYMRNLEGVQAVLAQEGLDLVHVEIWRSKIREIRKLILNSHK